MNVQVKRKPLIHILLIGLAFFSAISGLVGLLNINQTDVFESLGTTVVIEESADYYFMIQSYNSEHYGVREAGNDTYIEFDNKDSVEVSIYSIDEAKYHYIEGLGANSSISINEFNVVGRVSLEKGSYLVKFNTFEGESARNGEYKLMQADTMVGNILRMVLSFIAGVLLVIGLIVRLGFRNRAQKQVQYTTESYVTNQYHKDVNNDNDYKNLFDTDDPFEAYSNDDKHK